ncbi:isopenicillin N synthase family oxygenase [Pseudomonas sp. S37]|uniref:isopenicillin N synthase family dioxygenase n=1 Tax=Pseudomonas sp. S37 TaxID=2767449 RepID=UPI00191360A6|nr:isopenicillin N synthase family oxygenase [Pseudomonas sp. S37]MBK4994894.1 isopenicillin N synthase family oxygenase [Pseudomonas sp. S37]
MRSNVNRSLDSKTTSFHEIPVVDLAPLLDGSDRQAVAEEIGHICEHVGFLYIKNHGVPRELIAQAYRLTAELFALPYPEKEKLSIVHQGEIFRGYIPMYTESPDPMNTRDHKECYDLGKHYDEVSRFFGPNPIPETIQGFREVFDLYHEHMMRLARELISAIAISLDLPADYFEKLQRKPITIHRLNYYPPQHGPISMKELGTGAHTDYGFLTILHQDDVGGLQVQNQEGDWISAPPIEDTFVVNIGDLVQTLTNDRYPATYHRVINTSGKSRYSIPFFIDMDYDAVVEPVPTCVSPSNPAKYQPYTCGAYKYGKFLETYTHLQKG